jgi:hypothetical protein
MFQSHSTPVWLLLACLLSGVAAWAEEPADAPQPVLAIAVRSVDRAVDVLHQFADLRGRPDAQPILDRAQQIRRLPGLDPTQPVKVWLFVNFDRPRQPDVLVSIPISDFPQFQQTCAAIRQIKFEPVGENRWRMKTPQNEFLAVYSDQRVLIATQPGLVSGAGSLASPDVTEEFDAAAMLFLSGVPVQMQAAGLAKFDGDIDRELARHPTDREAEQLIRETALGLIRQTVHLASGGTRSAIIGLKLDRQVRLTARWSAAADSELARTWQAMPLRETRWRTAPAQPALRLRWGLQAPESVGAALKKIVTLVRGRIREEIGAQFSIDDKHPAMGVFDCLEATLSQGRLCGSVTLASTAEKAFTFQSALSVERGDRLNDSLRTVLPFVARAGGIRSVDFDAVQAGGLTLHRVQRNRARPREERLYGADPAIYVGTSPGEVLFALGGPQAAAQVQETSLETATDPPLAELDAQLRPWIDLASQAGAKGRLIERLQAAFPAGTSDDALHAELGVHENSLELQVRAGIGFLRLLAVSL